MNDQQRLPAPDTLPALPAPQARDDDKKNDAPPPPPPPKEDAKGKKDDGNDGSKDDAKDDKKGDDKDAGKGDDKGDDKGKGEMSPEKKKKVKIGLFIGAGVAILIALIWFIWHMMSGRYHEETDDAYIQADAVTVSPKVGGYVEEVLVHENQDVKAGQALVRVDPRDYNAQAEQFKAQIDIARANADAVRSQIVEQESAVDAARAQLAAARDAAAFAAGEVKRYTPLVQIGAETAQTLADRRNQAAQAAENASAQRAALANAEKRIPSLRAQIRQAEAQGEVAAAQLRAANVNLQSTTLTASLDGRIGDSTVRVGQFVQPGTRLMTLVPMGSLYITANYKETQIGRMRVGQPADVKVDALPGVKLRGRVESVAPGTGAQFSLLPPQNATGNFTKIVQRVPVRIRIDASPETTQALVPGLSVKVTVDTSADKHALKDVKEDEKDHQKREDAQTERARSHDGPVPVMPPANQPSPPPLTTQEGRK